MSQFDPEVFMSKPDGVVFFNLRKEELVTLGRYLQLRVMKSMPKTIIQAEIVSHLNDVKVFGMAELGIMKEKLNWKIRRERQRKELQERLEEKKRQEKLEREEKERQEKLEREEKERQEKLEREEKERQEKLEREEKERQEKLEREEKERQEKLEREENERQDRLEEKQRQEGLEKERLALQHELENEEKLLPGDSESINLLQYVSDFRTKLFRACELARDNLSSSQKSMKNKYDVDAVERSFKPGQKVLALLPVPGNPLNARFFGPYVIQKKLSNLNYLVVTPDRRKQTQLCHVNMLKPYVKRSSDPVLQPANVNVVDSEPEELSNELSSSNSLSPTDTTKLTNVNVLRNLDSKMSHPQESQRLDLEKILLEFKNLFPDLLTRMDQIYHDVKVSVAASFKQHPSKQQYFKEVIS